jgi:hypothetical protein
MARNSILTLEGALVFSPLVPTPSAQVLEGFSAAAHLMWV